jgi:hypothetical protein
MHVVELSAHHRAQHATAAMRREGAHDRHPGGRNDRPWNGQLERKGARAADDHAVLARRVHALDRQVLREALHALLGRLHAEVLPDREDCLAELLEVRAGRDGERH